jgi:hypothetical protein
MDLKFVKPNHPSARSLIPLHIRGHPQSIFSSAHTSLYRPWVEKVEDVTCSFNKLIFDEVRDTGNVGMFNNS